METDWAWGAPAPRRAVHGTAYRGADRRGLIRSDPPRRLLWTVLLATTLPLGGLLVLSTLETAPAGVHTETLRGQLGVVSVTLALLLAALCHLYWRLVGAAMTAWLTPAMTLFAVAGAVDAVVLTADLDAHPVQWIRFVSLVAALAMAGLALLAPDVDARLHPRRLAAGCGTGVPVGSAFVVAIAGVLGVAPPGRGGAADATLAMAWLLLGAYSFRTALRAGRPLSGWFGILFLSLGYGPLLALGAGPRSLLASHLLELTGLLVASGGALGALTQAWAVGGERLRQAEHQRRSAEARQEAYLTGQAERAHEARNALMAIDGATSMLRDCSHRLTAQQRERLSAAVSAEIARLQLLVTGDNASEGYGPFRVAEALAAVVACEESLGTAIHYDVPDDLVALGSPSDTAEAVQNLLQNARCYAGSAVTIEAVLDDDGVVLRVSDQGPGVPVEDRERVFERGWRGASGVHPPGSGLGLHISRRLMERQGGDLWLTEEHRGGACFALRLPGFSVGDAQVFSLADVVEQHDARRPAPTVVACENGLR